MKRYPAYKDSGVAWIDQLPDHWFIIPFRRVIEFLTDFEANGSFSSLSEHVNDDFDKKYAWYVRATDLENQNYETFEDCRFIDEDSYQYLSKTKLYGEELLIAKRGEIGKLYLMPNLKIKASLAPNLYLIRLTNEKMSSFFAYYYFISDIGHSQLTSSNKSTTIGALYKDDCKKLEILYPSLSEQSQIASFLDYKTRQIDDLIDKKQKIIELLIEERTVIINQTITKGLDPTVPMKDSGIEWLGDIPKHWEICSFKRVIDFLTDFEANGSFSSLADKVNDDPINSYAWFVRATDLENLNYNDFKECRFIDKSSYEFLYKTKLFGEELLIAKRGEIGKVYLMPKVNRLASLAPNLYLIKINQKELMPLYAYYFFISDIGKGQLTILNKSTTIGALYKDDCKELKIFFPPVNEQEIIVDIISKFINKSEITIENITKEIELINEYKTSLINEAVTGKFDVRDYQINHA